MPTQRDLDLRAERVIYDQPLMPVDTKRLAWIDRVTRGEVPGWHLTDEARELLMDLAAEIRFLKGHGTDAEPAESLSHLQFSGDRYPDRNPLCIRLQEGWHVAQPDEGGRVMVYPLPKPWQEWLENEGGWRFVWTDEDDWTLEYVR